MKRRSLKQKCLAWLLSLAVAVTFIPMTAGFAFADDENTIDPETDVMVEVDKDEANDVDNTDSEASVSAFAEAEDGIVLDLGTVNAKGTGTFGENGTFYLNLSAPWYDSSQKENVDVIGANGTDQKAEVDVIKVPKVGGASENAYEVSYSTDEWITPGEYTITVTGKSDVVAAEKDGTKYYLTGKWEKKCKIVDSKDLSGATITLEYNKCDFDGKEHKPEVTLVEDALGNEVDREYYTVSYPSDSKNAYIKVGKFDVVVTAIDGNAGGYTNSGKTVIQINDEVTTIEVYSQNGLKGKKTLAKQFVKASWGGIASFTPFKWCYNKSKGNDDWETSYYIPLEDLLAEAGLGAVGGFNKKDNIDVWSNSTVREHYFNAPQTISELQKWGYTADGKDLLAEVFAGEYKIPAFLILDTEEKSSTPMLGVGYSGPGASAEECPAGNMFPKPVSEVILVSMDIAGLNPTVANATYTGKALKPKVTVKDGSETVPVTVAYSNNTKAGKGTVKITAKSDSEYYGTVTKTFTIAKAANPLTVKPKTATVKKAKVKKKAQTIAKAKVLTVSKNQGKVTYTKVSGSAKLKIAKSTGKVTVKKKTKKGTYKMKVKVAAAGNANYKAGSKTVTVTVKVK